MSEGKKAPSARTRVRRLSERGRYDRQCLLDVLGANAICHVALAVDGEPVVIPTLYWFDDERLYFHGSVASRLMRGSTGQKVCISIARLDGLVLARSAFHHSANYRSAVIYGIAEPVKETSAAEEVLRQMMATFFPDRWDQLRPVSLQELKATRVLSVALDEASVKVRTGPPADLKKDLRWPVWAGVVPIQTVIGAPVADAGAHAGGSPVPSVKGLRRLASGADDRPILP